MIFLLLLRYLGRHLDELGITLSWSQPRLEESGHSTYLNPTGNSCQAVLGRGSSQELHPKNEAVRHSPQTSSNGADLA